jgi:hypothetical protein
VSRTRQSLLFGAASDGASLQSISHCFFSGALHGLKRAVDQFDSAVFEIEEEATPKSEHSTHVASLTSLHRDLSTRFPDNAFGLGTSPDGVVPPRVMVQLARAFRSGEQAIQQQLNVMLTIPANTSESDFKVIYKDISEGLRPSQRKIRAAFLRLIREIKTCKTTN